MFTRRVMHLRPLLLLLPRRQLASFQLALIPTQLNGSQQPSSFSHPQLQRLVLKLPPPQLSLVFHQVFQKSFLQTLVSQASQLTILSFKSLSIIHSTTSLLSTTRSLLHRFSCTCQRVFPKVSPSPTAPSPCTVWYHTTLLPQWDTLQLWLLHISQPIWYRRCNLLFSHQFLPSTTMMTLVSRP